MENGYQYEDLLVKFLSDGLNAEEEAKVLTWINANEQNFQYYEQLKKTWNVTALKNSLEHINVDDEWRQLEPKISFKKPKDEQHSLAAERIINEGNTRSKTIYNIIISTAIAASVLFVIGLGFGVFETKNKSIEPEISRKASKRNEVVVPFLRREKNITGEPKELVLQDGTKVTLFDKSEISFPEPFARDSREITLKGKATFEVAKDKTKPFTVFSGDLSTTALGTQFTVTAFLNHDFITVRLFEGRVVVKTNYNRIKSPENHFFLVPGEELVYNNKSTTATVSRFAEKRGVGKSNIEKPSSDSLVIPKFQKGSWFMFNNQSLDKVFDQLENMYQVDIEYSKRDLYNLYFIGKFDKKDSLEGILKQIAALNNLKVIKKNNKFIIKK